MTSVLAPLRSRTRYDFQRRLLPLVATWSAAALLVAALFGRIMTTALGHDEEIHVAAARLVFSEPLYGELGYNHLPGLPLLLGSIYALSGSDHLLLVGRLLIFLCWMMTALILWVIARHYAGGWRVPIVAILVLAAGTLLGPAGMLVTNNLLPIPFAMLGFHWFVLALDDKTVRPGMMFGAGVAIGFAVILKVSYVFLVPPLAVAALIVPRGLPWVFRLRRVLLPLVAGGLVGGLPVFILLATEPATLIAHTIRYFTVGHLAYWQHATEPKAMTITAKTAVAYGVWLAESGLLTIVLVGTSILSLIRCGGDGLRWWPVPLAAALALLAALGSFAPTPAFPQYYEPPLPFLIILFILLQRLLDRSVRRGMRPLLDTVAVAALLIMLPRLVPALPRAVQPALWTGSIVHDQGVRIRDALQARGAKGKIATLSPIVALEGERPIYREFGAGPFVYRVAPYLPVSDRALFVTTSPAELRSFLDADPPAAIVTGREPNLEREFLAYARARHYDPVDIGDARTRLFVRTAREPAVVLQPAGRISASVAPLDDRPIVSGVRSSDRFAV